MKASRKFESRLLKEWNRSPRRHREGISLPRPARLATVTGALLLGGAAIPGHAVTISTPVSATVALGPTESLDITAAGSVTPPPGADGVINSTSGITVGSITNAGSVNASGSGSGIAIFSSATVNGDITNSGAIDADDGGDGILLSFGASVTGSITNAAGGTIDSDADGVAISSSASVGTDIRNDGIINAGLDGISLFASSTVTGAIVNTGTINASLLSSFGDGIFISSFSEVGGGIRNEGTINANGADDSDGLDLRTATIAGGITNTAGGLIDANDDGVSLSDTIVDGGISNQGRIEAGDDGIAITSFSSLVDGGITNEGTIVAGDEGIYVSASSTINDGIRNEGTIESGDDGIDIESSIVNGGITNAAGGVIDAGDDGIDIDFAVIVNGGINNAGVITAAEAGIDVTSNAVVDGGITNSGSITGALEVFGGTGSGDGIDLLNSGLLDIGESESFLSGDFTQDMNGTLAVTLMNFGDYGFAPLDVDDAFLDGLLDLDFVTGFALSPGQRFTLLDVFGTRTGVFSNFADEGVVATFNGLDLFIDYTSGGDVDLYTEAPAPGSLALLGLWALPLLAARRRRQ